MGLKGADPAGLRSGDSSKVSMALICELTGWFLSPTLSMEEPQRVLCCDLSLTG